MLSKLDELAGEVLAVNRAYIERHLCQWVRRLGERDLARTFQAVYQRRAVPLPSHDMYLVTAFSDEHSARAVG